MKDLRYCLLFLVFLCTVLLMLTSVNASNVNDTIINAEDNIQIDTDSMVHVTNNISKKIKQESHDGYVYVNSKGTGDGSDITTPANITTALTKVTNGGTLYLVTNDSDDTYYFNTRLNMRMNINSSTIRNFNITAQQGKTITFIGNSTPIWIHEGHTINITGITFADGNSENFGAIMNRGNLTINNSIFINYRAANQGGAIYNDMGNLNITNSIFINNTAVNGTIYNNVGNIILNNNTFLNNIVTGLGGVILGNEGNATITNNLFMNNSAKYGGAICLTHRYGRFYDLINKVSNNTFINNKATYGGAIYSFGTDTTINNNIFINNTATTNQGGGAILNSISNQTIKNNTFTNNNAKQGGVIYSIQGNQNITSNTFTNNTAKDNSNSIYNYYTNQLLINNTLPNNTVIIKRNLIEEKDMIVYTQRDVVPANTSEKIYTVENNPDLYTTIVFPLRNGQPVPFNDNSTSFCTEIREATPIIRLYMKDKLLLIKQSSILG